MDPDLPAKIQCLVAQVSQKYIDEARFELPDEQWLNCEAITCDILRNTANLTLIPAIHEILRPVKAATTVT